MSNHPCRRAYDHRLRDLVHRTRDLGLAAKLGVPRRTAQSWIRRGPRPVVTAPVATQDAAELERRVAVLLSVVRLLLALARVVGVSLGGERLPAGEDKRALLGALARATR